MPRPTLSLLLITCLFVLSFPAKALSQPDPSGRSSTSAQRTSARRRVSSQKAAGAEAPSVTIVSNRSLNRLLIEHKDNIFTITIRDVGLYRISGNGRGYDAFDQQQAAGRDDLILSFRLLPGVTPQYIRQGNQIDIFFATSLLPLGRLNREPSMPVPTFENSPVPFSSTDSPRREPTTGLTQPTRSWPVKKPQTEMSASVSGTTINGNNAMPAGAGTVTVAAAVPEPTINPSTCRAKCDVPESEREGDVAIVNANDPNDFVGPTRFPRGGKVFFVKKNPFKYTYKITRKDRSIEAGIIEAFLGHIFGADINTLGEGIPVGPDTVVPAGDSAAICAGQDNVAYEALQRDAGNLRQAIDSVTKEANKTTKAFNKAKNDYNAFLELTDTGTEGLNCERACEKANDLLPQLKKIDLGTTGEQIVELKERVISLQVRAREFVLSNPGSKPECKELFSLLGDAAGNYKTTTEELEKKFKELQKAIDDNQKKFDSLAKIINSVYDVISSGGNPFIEVHTLRVDDDAKEVEFTIARKNLRVENAQEVAFNTKPTFQVGESRLSLSAGFGFSTINEFKIVRQASLVPDAMGVQTLGNRFGFENRSKFRPSGVLLLNAHLMRFGIFNKNDTTLALSGGLVLSERSSGSTGGSRLAAEFIVGPSLGFINNRMFLTFGFHAARVEELAGGFKIGDPVPDGLPDPIPVEKNWRNGLMFSITYRIRPR